MSDPYSRASADGRPVDDPYPGRRQLYELTSDELRATLAWWFPGPDGHLTGPDAGTVMPLDTSVAAEDGSVTFPPEGDYLLHARFTLADGSVFDGHVAFHPDDDGGIASREPTVCTDTGQVPLWHGVLVPSPDEIGRYLAAFGRHRDAVFPLTWVTSLHPPERNLTGSLDGFAILRDGRVEFV